MYKHVFSIAVATPSPSADLDRRYYANMAILVLLVQETVGASNFVDDARGNRAARRPCAIMPRPRATEPREHALPPAIPRRGLPEAANGDGQAPNRPHRRALGGNGRQGPVSSSSHKHRYVDRS